MSLCNCHPPFPRPEPFSPMPRPGHLIDHAKWIKEQLAKKYEKPADGIPKTDLEAEVQDSLDLADSAVQSVKFGDSIVSPDEHGQVDLPKSDSIDLDDPDVIASAKAVHDLNDAKYDKQANGIPKTDLASGVQTSLDLADNSLQNVAGSVVTSNLANNSVTSAKIQAGNVSTRELADGAVTLAKISGTAFDGMPATGSDKLVTSGGIADFVNSSIATNTATFRGTYNLVTDLMLTIAATHEHVAVATSRKMELLSITPENNDYCFVQVPTADATPTEISRIDRYKCTVTESGGTTTRTWSYEFSLNNSSFTAAQWAAINSGVTGDAVTKLAGIAAGAQVNVIETVKVNGTALTPDADKAVDVPVPQFSLSAPRMDGSASAGVAETAARSDHRHPTDTTRKSDFNFGTGFSEQANNLYAYKGVDGTSTEGQTVYTLGAVASVGSKLYTWDGTTLTDTLKTVSSVYVGTGRIYTSMIPAVYYERAASNDVSRPPTVNVATVAPSPNAVAGNVADAKSVWDELLKLAPDWKTSTAGGSYVKYDVVRYNHNYYYNKTGTNTNTIPSGDTTNWGSLANLAAFFAKFLPLTGGNISGRLGIGGFEFEVLDEDETLGINDGEGYFKFGKGGWLLRHGVAAVLSDIGIPAFDPTATYAVGAKVVYGNAVWNCTTAISTAGAWTGTTNWTKLFDLDTGAPASGGTKLITNGQAYTEFAKYLPLAGGTMTGDLTARNLISQIRAVSIGGAVGGAKFILQGASDEHYIQFAYQNSKYGLFVKNGANDAGTFYALADFASLASPAFTGTPTAPTPTAGDDSTKVATTAFVQDGVRYSLGAVQTISTASQDTSGTETIDYGAATMLDRTGNYVAITTALDELRITFPPLVNGKMRDFLLRVEVGTGSAALTAPAFVCIAPTGETITLENPDGTMPTIVDGTATAKGVTYLLFSESAVAGKFVVRGIELKEVA